MLLTYAYSHCTNITFIFSEGYFNSRTSITIDLFNFNP